MPADLTSSLPFLKKAASLTGRLVKHVIIVFMACIPATMIGVLFWSILLKGALKFTAAIFMSSIGIALLSPFLFLIYLPIALLIWRCRLWPITFPLAGAAIAAMGGALLLGKMFKISQGKDVDDFLLVVMMPGALTGLFHYMLLCKLEQYFPGMSDATRHRPITPVAIVVASLVVLLSAGALTYHAVTPKSVKESCLHDMTVHMGDKTLVIPREYWPDRKDGNTHNSQRRIQTTFYQEEWQETRVRGQDKCDTKELDHVRKVNFANMKLTNHADDAFGPAWYERRHAMLGAAKPMTVQEYPSMQQLQNAENGNILYILPVEHTAAADGAPVLLECTPPTESKNLGTMNYAKSFCYANYKHASGLQLGYKIANSPDGVKDFVAIDQTMQKQVQALLDAAANGKRKPEIMLESIPFARHAKCNNNVTFTLNGHVFKSDPEIFGQFRATGKPIHYEARPETDCSIENIGVVEEVSGERSDDSFTLREYTPPPVDVSTPDPRKRAFTGRVPNTFRGMNYVELPLDKHPTFDGKPVKAQCSNPSPNTMGARCHISYIHPMGFKVEYQRQDDKVDLKDADLAVRRKIDEMLNAAKSVQ